MSVYCQLAQIFVMHTLHRLTRKQTYGAVTRATAWNLKMAMRFDRALHRRAGWGVSRHDSTILAQKGRVHSILGLICISVRLILHQTLGHVLFHQFFQVRH